MHGEAVIVRHVCRLCGEHVEGIDEDVIERAKALHEQWHQEEPDVTEEDR